MAWQAPPPLACLAPLKDGDDIRVGPVTLTFRLAPPTGETVTLG